MTIGRGFALGLRRAPRAASSRRATTAGETLAQADVGEQLLRAMRAPMSRSSFSQLLVADLGESRIQRAQRLLEQALAERGRLLVLHGLEEMADVRARLAGLARSAARPDWGWRAAR